MPLTLTIQSFLRYTTADVITRASTSSEGSQASDRSWDASFSADGRYVSFLSTAGNLTSDAQASYGRAFRKDLWTGQVLLASSTSEGAQGNDQSATPALSADGRYLVFTSAASNLVQGDGNGQDDVFRKDLATGQIEIVSRASDSGASNSFSANPSMSADGRYVVFDSAATNLVANDTNGVNDIFRKDLQTGALTRVSITNDGIQANGGSADAQLSPDGQSVLFTSNASNLVGDDTNGNGDIFWKSLMTGEITRVSTAKDGAQGNGGSFNGVLSANQRYVVFQSDANNLVAGDDNGYSDIFRKDLVTG